LSYNAILYVTDNKDQCITGGTPIQSNTGFSGGTGVPPDAFRTSIKALAELASTKKSDQESDRRCMGMVKSPLTLTGQ
jgi:hypothetical protein